MEALPSFLFVSRKLALLPLHGVLDDFTQYGGTRFPLTLLRLKPKVGLFIDINYNSWHGRSIGQFSLYHMLHSLYSPVQRGVHDV